MSQWDDSPSFSSTLLDKIYRSIDEGGCEEDVKFYVDTKKKTTKSFPERKIRNAEKEEMAASALRRACLIEKCIEIKAKEKAEAERRRISRDHDDGSVIFSSNSCSSESSSGGLSSSDYESTYGARPPQKATSCFVPSLWPKPIRTRPLKTEQKQSALFPKHRDSTFLDDDVNTRSSNRSANVEESTIKNKSRGLKLYDDLKKVKQPISPGGRVASFLNSLVKKNPKKAKSSSLSSHSCYEESERRIYSLQGSTCSSASSFSRSCLSKHSPSTREKLRNGVKKSIQFGGEDRRHCGQKCVYEEQYAHFGRSQSRTTEEVDIVKLRALEKNRQSEQAAREYLKDHCRNQAKNESLFTRDFDDHDDDMDDDAASCSSSELFELDHLAVAGKERYLEELPVYETTRVNRTNRAIF